MQTARGPARVPDTPSQRAESTRLERGGGGKGAAAAAVRGIAGLRRRQTRTQRSRCDLLTSRVATSASRSRRTFRCSIAASCRSSVGAETTLFSQGLTPSHGTCPLYPFAVVFTGYEWLGTVRLCIPGWGRDKIKVAEQAMRFASSRFRLSHTPPHHHVFVRARGEEAQGRERRSRRGQPGRGVLPVDREGVAFLERRARPQQTDLSLRCRC